MTYGIKRIGGLVSLALALLAAPVAAQTPSVHFSQQQVNDGRGVYAAHCVNCHGVNLEGGAGRALSGVTFAQDWSNRALRDFYEIVTSTMPPEAVRSLSESDYLAVTAYVLSRNGYDATDRPLTAADLAATVNVAQAEQARAAAKPTPQSYPVPPATVSRAGGTLPNDAELVKMADGDWLGYDRTLDGQRYSPLKEITAANAGALRPSCLFQLGEVGSFEANPVVYAGTLYITGRYKTSAINAGTCVQLWQHVYVPADPDVAISAARGVALYRGKVFRGTSDAHLLALDATTGKLLWDARVNDSHLSYSISAAVVAFDGKVFVGEAGGDSGIKGHIYAFDAEDGHLVWMFDLIPTGKQFGANTWSAGTEHGGGAMWSGMTIDPARNLLLVPTGNPGPDYNADKRRGDNLFTDSIVALDIATGKLAWYVQQVPHDVHDWDTAGPPALYERGGKGYMAVASKDGYLYVYDRDTRKIVAKAETMSPHVNTEVPLSYEKPVMVCPGIHGQYFGAAYTPALNMLFVGSEYRCSNLQLEEPRFLPGQDYYGGTMTYGAAGGTGFIRGFDAVTGKQIWDYHSPVPINSGVTATAGDIVLAGDRDGYFFVMDAKTGNILYRFMTGGAVAGGIAAYLASGKEYIAVVSGNSSRALAATHGAATVEVFGLP